MTRPPRLHILIVEDELENAFALQYLLQAHGHAADIATDADTALAKCRLLRYDAVVCDIELRGALDGYDVARILRRQPQRPYLIAYSGYGGPQRMVDSLDAGFDEHIVKPATPQQILSALHRSR